VKSKVNTEEVQTQNLLPSLGIYKINVKLACLLDDAAFRAKERSIDIFVNGVIDEKQLD
jgi:hypothetical protein